MYQHMVAAIHCLPGSTELGEHLQKLWILAKNWMEKSLEEMSNEKKTMQMLEMGTDLVKFVKARRTMPGRLSLETMAERDVLPRTVFRAMHLLFLFIHRFQWLFNIAAPQQQDNQFMAKLEGQLERVVDADVVPELIGERLYQRFGEVEKKEFEAKPQKTGPGSSTPSRGELEEQKLQKPRSSGSPGSSTPSRGELVRQKLQKPRSSGSSTPSRGRREQN
jgi:hypothetical protein